MTKKKFVSKEVDVDKITTGAFQVRDKNPSKNIEPLCAGIKNMGLLQPIGLAKSEQTEKSDKYDYEILWGQRRHLAFKRLGMKKIPALVLDEVLTKAQGKKYAIQENIIREDMSRSDIWNTIREFYIEFDDPAKCADEFGIPLPLVKDALKANLLERIKGGKELFDFALSLDIPKQTAFKVIDIVKNPDNVSVNTKKGQSFCKILSTESTTMRNKLIAAAKRTPSGEPKGWLTQAKAEKNYKKRTVELEESFDDALKTLSDKLGSSPEDIILESVLEKLESEELI
ncbi:MAG: ParB N-terminal domain-containing protein [Nitrospinota bacterium]|nr:ParB N-terminal domain-containing protein [Nitrospinota bacterium]